VIFDPPARPRHRVLGRLIVPLLIAVVVIVAAVVTDSGEETRTELDYLDSIRTQATELARSGAALRDLMPRVREINREEFVTVMDGVVADLDVAMEFVGSDPPVESLIPVWSLYRQTVQAWNDGIRLLSDAILRAADNPEDAAVVNDVADALGDIRTGDNLFRDLRAEFERDEVPTPVGELADVQLSPGEGGLVSLSASYVAAAQASTNGLGLRPGLQVTQVLAEPAWEINVDGQAVVPATDTITFSVVVTNVGNIASQPESIRLQLAGGEEPVLAEAEVPTLEPAGQTTIAFDPLEVIPDTPYQIAVELALTNPDSDLTDNALAVPFIVNTP
jgi:hypothetical protein